MIGLVYCIVALVVIITATLWVRGIVYMQENHPDYKGNQDGFDFDDEIKDWDITVADGLDELQKDENKK